MVIELCGRPAPMRPTRTCSCPLPVLERSLHLCGVQAIESWHAWDSNPLYAILHESIYCQGGEASAWAAERVRREAPFAELFDAVAQAEAGLPVYFTGEMIFPWMFDEVGAHTLTLLC